MQYLKELDSFVTAMSYKYAAGTIVDPEDLKQAVMEKFMTCLGTLRDTEKIKGWLGRIVHNRFLNMQRDLTLRSIREQESMHESEETKEDISDLLLYDLIMEGIKRLEPEYREIVQLRLLDEFSTKETAQKLGIPEGTVSSRLSRAKDKLSQYLLLRVGKEDLRK